MLLDYSGVLHTELSVSVEDILFTCTLDSGFFDPSAMTYEQHMHTEFELHIMLSGTYKIEFLNPERVIDIPHGNVMIIPPGCWHNTLNTKNSEKYTLRFRISKSSAQNSEGSYDALSKALTLLNDAELLPIDGASDIFSELRAEMLQSRAGSRDMAEAYLKIFFVKLLRCICGSKGEKNKEQITKLGKIDSQSARETKIAIFLDRMYMKQVTEAQLAEHLNLSLRQTRRLFQSCYGITFREKLGEVRLNHACKLLARTSLSIEDIAGRVGYGAPSAFFIAFKKRFGMTPGEYRRIQKNNF